MAVKDTNQKLFEYNSVFKENNDLYRGIARMFGLPDCAFWILYALREGGEPMTQSEICNAMYQPKQTVNSALKKLEQDGYIELKEMNDRRSKRIVLTNSGLSLAKNTVDRVMSVESDALSGLTEEEQDCFIRLFHKYTDLLRDRMQEL